MTLNEYKEQSKRISEEIQNFTGTPEESAKFFEGLSKKYPDVIEFNARAAKCKDIGEFKTLADSFGMVFSSDESAEKLFSLLLDGTKRIEKLVEEMKNGAELNDELLDNVTGGRSLAGMFAGAALVFGGLIAMPFTGGSSAAGVAAGLILAGVITAGASS